MVKLATVAVLAVAGMMQMAHAGVPSRTPNGIAWVQQGKASWYGGKHAGRITANGEHFNLNAMTAAHRSLPFNTRVRVTDETTGRAIVVRVNDRGPYKEVGRRHPHFVAHPTRIIDLSKGAAKRLGLITGCKSRLCEPGVKPVRVEVLSVPEQQFADATPQQHHHHTRILTHRRRHR